MNFTLVNQRFFRFVYEFDRVFHGEDVVVFAFVDIVDHRRQRGRFTGTGRAGNQYNTAWNLRQIFKHLTHAQLVHGQNFRRNGTEHRTGTAVVVKGVHTETRHTRYFEREVSLKEFFEILTLLIVHDVIHQAMNFFMPQCWQVDTAHIAINPDHWRQAGR